jgi:hypothetical protein
LPITRAPSWPNGRPIIITKLCVAFDIAERNVDAQHCPVNLLTNFRVSCRLQIICVIANNPVSSTLCQCSQCFVTLQLDRNLIYVLICGSAI